MSFLESLKPFYTNSNPFLEEILERNSFILSNNCALVSGFPKVKEQNII